MTPRTQPEAKPLSGIIITLVPPFLVGSHSKILRLGSYFTPCCGLATHNFSLEPSGNTYAFFQHLAYSLVSELKALTHQYPTSNL